MTTKQESQTDTLRTDYFGTTVLIPRQMTADAARKIERNAMTATRERAETPTRTLSA